MLTFKAAGNNILGTTALSVLLFSMVIFAKPSPDKALQLLQEGNSRFVSGKSIHPHTNRARLTQAGRENQGDHAYATIITCSDSRVPVERVFDAGVMDLFIIRVAGNVCATDEIGSIEYGIAHVNTPVLVILGHTQCGAVTAVTHAVHGTGHQLERNIPPLVAPIRPAVEIAMHNHPELHGDAIIPAAIEQNVWKGIEDLFMESPAARRLVSERKVTVIGAIYDVGSGKVKWLPESRTGAILATVNSNPKRAMNEFAGSSEHASDHGSAHGTIQASTSHSSSAASSHDAAVGHQSRARETGARFEWGKIMLTIFLFILVVGIISFGTFTYTRNKNLRVRLMSSFALIVLILIGLGTIIITSLFSISREMEVIALDDLPILANLSDIEVTVVQQALEMEKFSSSHDNHFAEMFFAQAKKVENEIHEVKVEITDAVKRATSEEHIKEWETMLSEVERIENEYNDFEETSKRMVEAVNSRNTSVIQEIDEELFADEEKMRKACSTLVVAVKEETIMEAEHAHAGVNSDVTMIIVICLIGIIGAGVLSFVLSGSIVSTLKSIMTGLTSGSDEVAQASEQLASSSQQLSEGASEQASSLEEISSNLEELSSMTKRNAENAGQADTLSTTANESTEKSHQAMQRMGDSINRIKNSSDETAKIIKTIDEIAMQTNLLALNAAVEAARAGEAGRGFAVVAEEVRNLAQRSAEAAKNTAALIEEAQKNADDGVNASSAVGTTLEEIRDSIRQVGQLISEVSTASLEQSQGIDQINTAVSQMDTVTQNNAANAEESSSASEELSGQAQNLNAMIQQLGTLIGRAETSMSHVDKREMNTSFHSQMDHKPTLRVARQPQKNVAAIPHVDISHDDDLRRF